MNRIKMEVMDLAPEFKLAANGAFNGLLLVAGTLFILYVNGALR